jgi:hypothetical protein
VLSVGTDTGSAVSILSSYCSHAQVISNISDESGAASENSNGSVQSLFEPMGLRDVLKLEVASRLRSSGELSADVDGV